MFHGFGVQGKIDSLRIAHSIIVFQVPMLQRLKHFEPLRHASPTRSDFLFEAGCFEISKKKHWGKTKQSQPPPFCGSVPHDSWVNRKYLSQQLPRLMTHDQQKLKHQVIQNKHNTRQYLRGDFNLVKDGNLPHRRWESSPK